MSGLVIISEGIFLFLPGRSHHRISPGDPSISIPEISPAFQKSYRLSVHISIGDDPGLIRRDMPEVIPGDGIGWGRPA
jgi:hypothetical protein